MTIDEATQPGLVAVVEELKAIRELLAGQQVSAPVGLLNTDQAAAFLSVSKRHWLLLVASGKAPKPLRFGRSVRWSRDRLEQYLNELQQGGK